MKILATVTAIALACSALAQDGTGPAIRNMRGRGTNTTSINATNSGTTTFPSGSSVTSAGVFTGDGGGLTNVNISSISNLNVQNLYSTNLFLTDAPETLQYGTPFTVVGLTSSNTLYGINVQWTNMSGTWVLALTNAPVLPVDDGIPTNNIGQPIPGYYSVYDSSSLTAGPLSSWPDIGPYDHDLTTGLVTKPTVLANFASGTRSVVAFSNAAFAATQTLTNHTYTIASGPVELFVMIYKEALTTSRENILTPITTEAISSDGYFWINSGTGLTRFRDGGTLEDGPGLPTASWVVVDVQFGTGSTGSVLTNNVVFSSGKPIGTAGITNSLSLGGPALAAVNGFAGKIASVIIYTNILSSGDRTSVYGYLTNRFH